MSKKEVKTNAMRMLDRMKIPYEAMTYECGDFIDTPVKILQTVSRPQTNLDMTTNWSIRHL